MKFRASHQNFCFALKTSTGGKSKDRSNLNKVRPKRGEEALLYPKHGSLKPKYSTKNRLTNVLEILYYKLNADAEKHLKFHFQLSTNDFLFP